MPTHSVKFKNWLLRSSVLEMNSMKSHSKESCTRFLSPLDPKRFLKCTHPQFKVILPNKTLNNQTICGSWDPCRSTLAKKIWKCLESILFRFWVKLEESSKIRIYQRYEKKPTKAFLIWFGTASKYLSRPSTRGRTTSLFCNSSTIK